MIHVRIVAQKRKSTSQTQVQTWLAMGLTRVKPRSDPGQTWTRFKPSMTASLNEDLKKQLYHDLTQAREDTEDVTNDPNSLPQQYMVEFLKEAEDAIRIFYATQAGAC